MIEEQAKKQIKEQETRKQAQQLMSFLTFSDVDDFEDTMGTKNFRLANFDPLNALGADDEIDVSYD